jgi:hypothetical protein
MIRESNDSSELVNQVISVHIVSDLLLMFQMFSSSSKSISTAFAIQTSANTADIIIIHCYNHNPSSCSNSHNSSSFSPSSNLSPNPCSNSSHCYSNQIQHSKSCSKGSRQLVVCCSSSSNRALLNIKSSYYNSEGCQRRLLVNPLPCFIYILHIFKLYNSKYLS